jgi:osmotically-inducible protein OsmY
VRTALFLLVVAAAGCGGPKRSEDPQVQDEEITRDIMVALHGNARYDDVRVTCRDGVAILEGIVTDESDREQAKRIAWRISGVREVQSRLRIRSR